MKGIAILGAACLALAGCANIHSYDKADTEIEAKDSDIAACRAEMSAYSSREEAKDIFDKCMADRGYAKTVKKYGM